MNQSTIHEEKELYSIGQTAYKHLQVDERKTYLFSYKEEHKWTRHQQAG